LVKNSRKSGQQSRSIGKKEEGQKKRRRSGVDQNTKTGKGAVNGKKRTNKSRVNGKKRTNKGTDNGKKRTELGDGEMVVRKKDKFDSWVGSVNPISEAEDDDEPQETPMKGKTEKFKSLFAGQQPSLISIKEQLPTGNRSQLRKITEEFAGLHDKKKNEAQFFEMPESKLRPTSESQNLNSGGLPKAEGLGSENLLTDMAINARTKAQLAGISGPNSQMEVNDLSSSQTEKSNSNSD
jgi:hypothetical protein